jgi:uncharacterized protein YjbJ (UPF0337 family)
MNRSLFEVTWKQLRVHVKTWWRPPSVPDDDLDRVVGNFDQFIGLIQEKYGYTRKRAEEEFYRRMASLRELREKYIEEEFRKRLAKIKARQKNHTPPYKLVK